MALHLNVHGFYQEWIRKADSYSTESLAGCFNKAFSLFTLYNKLYAEATFILAKRGGEISFNENGAFPDNKGATEFAPRYIGFSELEDELENCSICKTALESLISSLRNHEFYICLSMPYGNRQPPSSTLFDPSY